MLFTSDEALTLMLVAKVHYLHQSSLAMSSSLQLQCTTTSSKSPIFFKLPQEIRNKIYVFALGEGTWRMQDTSNCDQFNFPAGLGDPSGFYFPLSRGLSMLRVDKQLRQEALPLAYRRTAFHLSDMDDLIKLLLAVGKLGRNNIESLEFAWESRADCERRWEISAPASDDIVTALPSLHVKRCVQLLKQCKRLSFLRLYIESDLISNVPVDTFQADPGIRELCAVRGIKRVEIKDLGYEPLEQDGVAKWLKEQLESPKNNEKNQQSGESYDSR